MHIEKENNRKEMGKQKSLKLNFVMNAILTMSQFVFPLITFPYVSRILLPIKFRKSIICNFDRILLYTLCTVENSNIRHSGMCKGA